MARALHKKQNSGGYIDRAISAQKREARRPSRRIVPDELDNVFDDVEDNAGGNADGGERKDVDGTFSEKGNNSDDASDSDDEDEDDE